MRPGPFLIIHIRDQLMEARLEDTERSSASHAISDPGAIHGLGHLLSKDPNGLSPLIA